MRGRAPGSSRGATIAVVASVYSEGVYVPNDRMEYPFRAIAVGGSVDWGRRAVTEIPLHRIRQVLLDNWTT
jgi:hypothetical protein